MQTRKPTSIEKRCARPGEKEREPNRETDRCGERDPNNRRRGRRSARHRARQTAAYGDRVGIQVLQLQYEVRTFKKDGIRAHSDCTTNGGQIIWNRPLKKLREPLSLLQTSKIVYSKP